MSHFAQGKDTAYYLSSILKWAVDLLRPHSPSLHKDTSPDIPESNIHSSVYGLELEIMHKIDDIVKILRGDCTVLEDLEVETWRNQQCTDAEIIKE